MRGNKGQRAPSNWTPGFTVLPGILSAATPLESPHPPLPCEDWGVSGETWHGRKRFESAGNQRQKDKKAKHTKTRNRLLGLIIIPDSPLAIPFLSATGIPQGGVHRAETALCQAAQAQDAPSREGRQGRMMGKRGPRGVRREKRAQAPQLSARPLLSPHSLALGPQPHSPFQEPPGCGRSPHGRR